MFLAWVGAFVNLYHVLGTGIVKSEEALPECSVASEARGTSVCMCCAEDA